MSAVLLPASRRQRTPSPSSRATRSVPGAGSRLLPRARAATRPSGRGTSPFPTAARKASSPSDRSISPLHRRSCAECLTVHTEQDRRSADGGGRRKVSSMKTMTCKQLGGPCDLALEGATADDVIKAQDRHLKQAVAAGDATH